MSSEMGSYWDRRADEDAFFFVDNRMIYGRADLDRFWADGEHDLDALLDAVGVRLRPEDEVVEIGCGVGRLTRVIARRAASVRAIDVSARMIALAREHNVGLDNVEWSHGDGTTLRAVPDASSDVCLSHVVFQHIPDPAITLNYVREIGRVLRPGGWAAFQISNDPAVHAPRAAAQRARQRVRAALGRGPRSQQDARWRGSMVELRDLREAASAGSMKVERIVGEGTQFCAVLTSRADRA